MRCASGVAVLFLGACQATVLKPTANDAIRAENESLKRKLAAAERTAASFEQQYQALKASDTTREPSMEVREATAFVTRLSLVSGSMIRREEGRDIAVLLFAAQDVFGHEMQAVGTLAITVTAARSGQEAVTLATATLPPLVLRDAYRAGFMGSHYTVELPLTGAPEDLQTALISATLTDGWTGKEFHTDAVLGVMKKSPTPQSAPDASEPTSPPKGS